MTKKKYSGIAYIAGDCKYFSVGGLPVLAARALHPTFDNCTPEESDAFEVTRQANRQLVLKAIASNELPMVTLDGHLPTTDPTWAMVSFEQVCKFAASLNIDVQRMQEFIFLTRPTEIPPELLAMNRLAWVVVRSRGSNAELEQSVQSHIKEIQGVIDR